MQLAPPQDIKLWRIFLLSIKIKQLGVWGGNGVVSALHKPLPENFRIFRLEMAYFGGFLGTDLIILLYNQVVMFSGVVQTMNLMPVFSSGKFPQSEDRALAKLILKVFLSPYWCLLGLGLTSKSRHPGNRRVIFFR